MLPQTSTLTKGSAFGEPTSYEYALLHVASMINLRGTEVHQVIFFPQEVINILVKNDFGYSLPCTSSLSHPVNGSAEKTVHVGRALGDTVSKAGLQEY